MNLTNWKILHHWVQYKEDIINQMPEESIKKFQEIEVKSNQYIQEKFPTNNKSKFKI